MSGKAENLFLKMREAENLFLVRPKIYFKKVMIKHLNVKTENDKKKTKMIKHLNVGSPGTRYYLTSPENQNPFKTEPTGLSAGKTKTKKHRNTIKNNTK